MKKSIITRRNFLGKTATAGIAGIVVPSIITGCARETEKRVELPLMLDRAPDGPILKAGLIGCGGRGTGAAINFLDAGPNLKIVALGDTFQDRVDNCRATLLKSKGQEIAIENCFVGFDAFEKVIASDVDIILDATPPYFRPQILAAAIQAGKHVFAEKPVAVDPVGVRSIMASAQKAKGKDLCIMPGTHYRHQRDRAANWQQVSRGAIGEIVGGNIYFNMQKLWHRDPNPAWSEMEYMIRDWVNWCWLSGDHIVEQHVHNIDLMNWFTGTHPVKATGFGSRQRRVTGDQYDNFSVDFVFENGIHFHSMCRQINGCTPNVSDRIQGTKGSTDCTGAVYDIKGNIIWQYEYPPDKDGNPGKGSIVEPHFQEQITFVTAIRNGKVINEIEKTAVATLVAIMGRVSAYTGKEVTYEEMMNSDMQLGPKEFNFGSVDIPKMVPVPGLAYTG